ncbi:uncharacterized protein LOC129693305 [Leucoraja erinacea]|uniref:uncharacterized protein LOC129693305 n=1 Tax=Leucoraja erinaceus TaxID=7782 RepID=UPI002453ADC0|nr:uncharacterized protein LOC129693305 [Leucoraja erinacea]
MKSTDHDLTPTGHLIRPTIVQVCEWVFKSWNHVKTEIVVKALKKCGTSNASEDNILFDDSDISNSSHDPDKLSCFEGNPEPEIIWYKGDKELTKPLEPTKFETLKDGKVHALRIYRCTENDAAVYQVSARNAKGIAICSSVLQVGLVTEAQVKRRMMQKLEERNRAKEAPSYSRVNGRRGRGDDGLVTTASIHLHLAERRARPPVEGGEQGSLERRPVAVAAYENSLDEAQASAVTRRPNTGKRHQLNEIPETAAGSQVTLSVGDQSCNTRLGDFSGAAVPRRRRKLSRMSDFSCEGLPRDAAEPCSPAYLSGATSSLTPEDHYYLDLLVCSDILTDDDNAAWRGKLETAAHLLLSAQSEEPGTDPVKLTGHPAPLGHPVCKLTTLDLNGSPRCEPEPAAVGNEGTACSTRTSTLKESSWTSEESRVRPGKGGAQSCPIPPQLPIEVETATQKGESLKRSPASTDKVKENHVGGKRDEWVSGNRIDLDKVDGDKTTEIKKGEVLKKEFWLKLPSTEDSPEDTGSSHGGVKTLSPGGISDAGEMYNSLLGTDTAQSPALRLSATENRDTATDSRPQHARGWYVQTPPSLKNDTTRMERECTHDREETAMSSEEKGDSSSDKDEVQLLIKDEATSFIKSITNSLFEDKPMACVEKKTNLLPLDTNVIRSSTQDSHDQEAACQRLETDSEILSYPPILDSAVSQSNEFKDKYQVQVLQGKKSNLISRENKLFCTSKEHQRSIYEPKIESTMHFIDSLKLDCFIESEKSDLGENTSVCKKEQEPLKKLSELCIHNENTDHQSSITSEGFESNLLNSKDESIDLCLGILPHISTPAQSKDISEPLHIGSNKFQDNENKSNEDSNDSSYCDTSDALRDDEIPFQVSECFGNESKQVDAHRDDFEHSESSFGVIVSDCKLGVNKELNGQSEEPVLENESNQTESPDDHWLPSDRAEMICALNASETKVHKEHISTHRSIRNDQRAENEANSCSDSPNKNEMLELHNSNGMISSPETNKLTAIKLDVKLTVEHPILFEYNLDIPLNQLIPKYLTIDNENNGSDYPSNKMESKTENVLAEPFMRNHHKAITSPLIDCEKMQFHKPPLLESTCCNSTDNRIKSNDKQFYNSVGFPSTEDEYSTTRLRTDQNSETMFPFKHFVELQNSNEPEVVKSDYLKSSMSQLDKNISPLIGTNEQRIINSEEKTVVKGMEHSEYPTHKEQRSPIALPVVNDQSHKIQQIFRPDQNSMKHVVEDMMEDVHRTLKTVSNVQTIPINNSEPLLFNRPNLNQTKIICSTFQNKSNFRCLSILEPDKMKAVENVHETGINPSGNIMCSLNPSLHIDKLLFPSPTGQVEKCALNHNIRSTECDSELGHDHVNNKTTSSKNLASLKPSVSPIEAIPSKTELVKGINIRSPTADLNENIQKAECVPVLEAKPSEISNTIENDNKIMESQTKEGQSINCREKKTVAVIDDGNKTGQQKDSVHLASMNSRGLSIIAQQVAGQIMNVNSTAAEKCREHKQSHLIKSTDQIIEPGHPQKDTKVDIDDESEVKIFQISAVPSKTNQKSSEVSKIENVTQTKNDNQAKIPGTETWNRSLDEAQKRTTEPKHPISLQSRSLFKKSIPAMESPNTAVRIKQRFPVQSIKDPMMSDGRKRSNFLNSSRDVASEFGILFPSQNERQKKEVKQVLPVDNIKLTLDKNKYVHSSAGKENLNKNTIVIKRTFHKTKEEPAYMKDEKEVENVKHSQKEEHEELDPVPPPKLIQKIRAEVSPDIPGNVKPAP